TLEDTSSVALRADVAERLFGARGPVGERHFPRSVSVVLSGWMLKSTPPPPAVAMTSASPFRVRNAQRDPVFHLPMHETSLPSQRGAGGLPVAWAGRPSA